MSECRLILGDALTELQKLPAASVDSLVTDPPAGISFMGKTWDKPTALGVSGSTATMPADAIASRNPCCRKCHGRRRAGPKTKGCSCEAPEWDCQEKRLVYREQFIAFLSAVMAEALRVLKPGAFGLVWAIPRTSHWTATALEEAGFEIRDRISHLFGQGFPKAKSCLKPACEDWWLVRKPGKMQPLQIDECRIASADGNPSIKRRETARRTGNAPGRPGEYGHTTTNRITPERYMADHPAEALGRWPANLILDEEAAALLDQQAGPQKSGGTPRRRFAAKTKNAYGDFNGEENPNGISRSEGQVSRFFYCAKATKADRGEGNSHPTVKPQKLMRHLVALVTPLGGLCLDCFAGSGSTGVACRATGRRFIGVEREAAYFAVAQRRLNKELSPCGTG